MLLRIMGISLLMFLLSGADARSVDTRSVMAATGVAEKSPGAVTLDFVDVPIAGTSANREWVAVAIASANATALRK